MSKYDKAGLAMIPSGYKASKVYSLIPNSSVGDFDFTRGSTATRINKDGLIDTVASGVPRLEYPLIDGVVQDTPSLLLEPSRTNLFEYSEDFSNAYWNVSRIETPFLANIVSPDGSQNSYTLEISNGETNGGGIFKTGISISGDNSFSVFAKKKTANYLALSDTGLTTNAVYFDLENGVVGTTFNATGEIQDFGNGWYKCTMKYNLTSSGIKFIYLSNIDGIASNAVQGGDSIYIYGAMLEQGSYPTSYIPTSGATVTRAAEICNGAGTSAEFNSEEGVLFAEISALEDDGTSRRISLSHATANTDNRVTIEVDETASTIKAFMSSGGTTVGSLTAIVDSQTHNNKVALIYKANTFNIYVNGFLLDTDPSIASLPIDLSRLQFEGANGSNPFYGKTKQLIAFKEALTDSELEDLTSWDSFNEMATAQEYSIK